MPSRTMAVNSNSNVKMNEVGTQVSAFGRELDVDRPDQKKIAIFNPQRLTALQKASSFVIGHLEGFFLRWGYLISTNPWTAIFSCLLVTVICALGLFRFTPENRPEKLWIPWNSEFVANTAWLQKNFPSPIRLHHAILVADNVLDPTVFKALLEIHEGVKKLRGKGRTWEDICFKVPVTKFNFGDNPQNGSRRKRTISGSQLNSTNSLPEDFFGSAFNNFDDLWEEDFFKEPIILEKDEKENETEFDPSIDLSPGVYCGLLAELEKACWEKNIVELWSFNETEIGNLTKEDILEKINAPDVISPVFGRPVDYVSELGKLKRENGKIVSAESVYIRWFAKINQTEIRMGTKSYDAGTGEIVDEVNLLWEAELVKFLENYSPPPGVKLYFQVARSFGDISSATIKGDIPMLAIGFNIVFIYVILMLGKLNCVELRVFLSLAGLSCVGMAILVSYGICSFFKIIYGPVHNVLPFLLLGIGIDDMFVIMQCWNNLTPAERKRSLTERMGRALKHAGVSITVTSLTDFSAFVIGATTVLPALQSFCVYAAIGIAAVFFFQATFFVACLSIDQRRIEERRNSILFCATHTNFSPNKCSQFNLAETIFEKVYARIILNKFMKVVIFMTTGMILIFGVWGNLHLRQEFNPIWFLPQDSYLFQYFMERDAYYPTAGGRGFIFFDRVDVVKDIGKIDTIVTELKNSSLFYSIEDWYTPFKKYVKTHFQNDFPETPLSSAEFYKYLGKFIFSPSGSQFQGRFKTSGNFTCGKKSPPIEVSAFDFIFKSTDGPEEHVPLMNAAKNIVKSVSFSGGKRAFVWSFEFAGWETDEIITVELYRNMALAMACVLVSTLLLIANIPACLMVFVCVIMTLVDVGGYMHFWGLTIDTVSCIDLVLAIGLCVDYAAHIAHTFMTCVGSRDERAKAALKIIGPAVLNGGFSTFLAFILLASSKSHVFITFFKIFFLVVIFGLYHGLVFLPVLLSVIGPPSYLSAFESSPSLRSSPSMNSQENVVHPDEDGEHLKVNGSPDHCL